MNKPIRLFILATLFLIFTTYIPSQNINNESLFFSIKEIKVENNQIIDSNEISKELKTLLGKNLLFVDKNIIKTKIDKFNFISRFYVKKIYPGTIKIVVLEKILIGIYLDGMNKFYITDYGDLIDYVELNLYKNLPSVYGKKNNFYVFFKDIKKLDLDIGEIKSFFYFDIGRWDIVYKDGKVIKLPVKNYDKSLINFKLFKNEKNFNKYKIFDYRIKDQLILK